MNKNNLTKGLMWVSGLCAGIVWVSYSGMSRQLTDMKRDYKIYRDLSELNIRLLTTENDLLKKELNKDEA